MAGPQDNRSWADLLHNSSQLLQSAAPAAPFPPIQRSLDQLESLSRQLKAKTSRFDTSGQSIAATRLLAREGINAEQLTRDLKAFELKTTFEDVFPVEATSVEEYLQQVHEMAMLTAVLNAQKDNVKSFDDYMMKAMEDDWQKEKREFLNNLSRLPLAPAQTSSKQTAGRISSGWETTLVGPKTQEAKAVPSFLPTQHKLLDSKAGIYAEVVTKLNIARERSVPFKVATAFKDAYLGLVGDNVGSKSVSMGKIWHLVQSLLGEDCETPRGVSKKMSMIFGARRHLEVGHEKFMLDTIQSHPAQAALGGSTGNLQRVRAFLRVRLRDHGLLDFDATEAHRQPPMDTTWYQIYFCMRSGYYEEAKSVAQASGSSRAFSAQLSEWIATGGMVSAATATAAFEECERIARMGDRPTRPGYDKKKMLLHAIICGARQQAEKLLRDIPVLFTTIEDFMWFMLSMVRDRQGDASSSQDGPRVYNLDDLQNYLNKFEPSYYTKSGKDPLVYPYVLLLSLQLHPSISYLTKEIRDESYQIDAVHIAISLADHGALLEVSSSIQKKTTMDPVTEVASIIRHYGLSYVRQNNLTIALEYYVQAAAAIGGGAVSWSGNASIDQQRQRNVMMKQLLGEILLSDGGIALLLGPFGTGSEGALKRFLPDPHAQQQLLRDAAMHCQESGLYDQGIELLKRIGALSVALGTINQRLSEAISAMSSGRGNGDSKLAGLISSGNEILDLCKTTGISSSKEREQIAEQQVAFRQLETILSFHRLARNGRYPDALNELSKLSFLPLTSWTAEKSSEILRNTSPAVQACVPDLLKVALTCLDNTPDTDGTVRTLKSKIASFVASTLPSNWPRDLYEQVARML